MITKKQQTISCGLIFIAAFLRLVPHPPNFAPIMAMALFSGVQFKNSWIAVLTPLLAMLISDALIGFHSLMIPIYFSFICIVLLGRMIQDAQSVATITSSTFAGSLIFFFITNTCVWLSSPFYSKDMTGLSQCFTLALPFFHYSLLGDAFFAISLFGGYWLINTAADLATGSKAPSL